MTLLSFSIKKSWKSSQFALYDNENFILRGDKIDVKYRSTTNRVAKILRCSQSIGHYDETEKCGFFTPDPSDEGESFIVIPPPNVTGSLHMGPLNNTLQTSYCYKRMDGFNALWVRDRPRRDATQWIVEKQLRAEGLTRHDLGRENS